MVLLCWPCHKDLHKDEHTASLWGWICWGEADLTPIRLYSGKWVLLVPDGTYEEISEREAVGMIALQNGAAIDPAELLDNGALALAV